MLRRCFHTLTFLLLLLTGFTAAGTFFIVQEKLVAGVLCVTGAGFAFYLLYKHYTRYLRKITFMFEAIENDDFAFKFPAASLSSGDNLFSHTLNRIKDLLLKAKADAAEKEKYYEIILNCVNTGILVLNEKGDIFQHNNEALRLLGLTVLTHVSQLKNIDEELPRLLGSVKPGEKKQTSIRNERGTVCLSVRASEIIIRNQPLRIIVLNDIEKELDEKEIDSWIRLIRVLTHEIMNSITPVTSLSDTLLKVHGHTNEDLRHGLEVISTTGKNLVSFVESYRRFTRIPSPEPTLFYVGKFVSRLIELACHRDRYPDISVETDIRPADLILYADEKLISQVMLNLLKNAVQAIGSKPDGKIGIKAYCNAEEEILIEVSNNGSAIPQEIASHIFIPFFTTKEGGSGIGLSVSRQIMRLSGGNIALKSSASGGLTTFVLTFK